MPPVQVTSARQYNRELRKTIKEISSLVTLSQARPMDIDLLNKRIQAFVQNLRLSQPDVQVFMTAAAKLVSATLKGNKERLFNISEDIILIINSLLRQSLYSANFTISSKYYHALMLELTRKNFDSAEEIIKKNSLNLNLVRVLTPHHPPREDFALHSACYLGQTDLLKWLISQGIDLNFSISPVPFEVNAPQLVIKAPLSSVLSNPDTSSETKIEMIRMLLKAGADPLMQTFEAPVMLNGSIQLWWIERSHEITHIMLEAVRTPTLPLSLCAGTYHNLVGCLLNQSLRAPIADKDIPLFRRVAMVAIFHGANLPNDIYQDNSPSVSQYTEKERSTRKEMALKEHPKDHQLNGCRFSLEEAVALRDRTTVIFLANQKQISDQISRYVDNDTVTIIADYLFASERSKRIHIARTCFKKVFGLQCW